MKKSLWVTLFFNALIITLILAALPQASLAAPAKQQPGWRAEYYDNPSLSGQPRVVRWEADFGHDWGYGSPAMEIPKDHFSARWSNRLHFEKGSYLFILNVDDGARMWLDGKLLIDAWTIGGKEQIKVRVRIDKTGDHELQIAYFEQTLLASIQLETIQLGGENDIVGAWLGEYYNNRNLTGDPVVVRQDGGISFNWNLGSPAPKVPRDNFSVRWTRSVVLKEGMYNLKIQHDDGMRIYIDGKIVYDSWYDQAVSYKTRRLPLKGGYRTFVVEFYDHIGNAVAAFDFEPDPGSYDDYDAEDGPSIIIKPTSNNFTWGGPASNRYEDLGGFGNGKFYWTFNSTVKAVNFGRWNPRISEAGNYEILAYIPGNRSTTSNARYQIHHYGYLDERSVNQGAVSNKFVSLGIYYFSGSGDEFVELYDSTGENAGSTQVAFDAVKFVRQND